MTLAGCLAHAAPPGVTLRNETDGDVPFIEGLYASTRAAELAPVPWPESEKARFLQSQFTLQRAHYRLHYADALFLLIERDGAPIGRIYLHESAGEIRLMEVALVPESRGRGLGTTLVRAIVTEACERGVRLTLHVEPDNPAQRLYARLGFRRVETRGIYDLLEWTPARPLDQLKADDFEEAAGQPFTLRQDSGDTVRLALGVVSRRPSTRPGGRAGFSLVFESEGGPTLPQRIYRLEHPSLGAMDVFLVPVGPGAAGMRYEAVFG